MNAAELFLVADRGVLRVYRLDGDDRRNLQLIDTLVIENAHRRFSNEYADQAGAFPNGGTAGQGNSIAERQGVAAENEMRSFRQIAEKMKTVLEANVALPWSFAAPPEINGAILDGLPTASRSRLRRNLPKDLVNVPADALLAHFQKD